MTPRAPAFVSVRCGLRWRRAVRLLVLRLLAHLSNGGASVTGLAFAASGLASAFAAVAYSAFVRRLSYVSVAVAAAVLLALSEVAVALVPDVGVIVLATAAAGLFYGVLGPALASMIGLEAPVQVQARVFGVSASAICVWAGASEAKRLGRRSMYSPLAAPRSSHLPPLAPLSSRGEGEGSKRGGERGEGSNRAQGLQRTGLTEVSGLRHSGPRLVLASGVLIMARTPAWWSPLEGVTVGKPHPAASSGL